MLEDIIEQSWTYQYIVSKGLAKGLEKGLVEGREEERLEWLQTQRKALISAVQARFPELIASVTEKVNRIEDPLILQDIMLKLASARDSEEARKHLLEL